MHRHGPVIAHCTDSEDFPISVIEFNSNVKCSHRLIVYDSSVVPRMIIGSETP